MTTLSLSDIKAHLNVTDDADDDLILAKMEAAEAFVAGYVGKALVDFDPVPGDLKEAVRMVVGHLYENREATLVGVVIAPVPLGAFELMAPHREWVF